jgi:hypothetical protein
MPATLVWHVHPPAVPLSPLLYHKPEKKARTGWLSQDLAQMLEIVGYTAAEALRIVSVLLEPVLPPSASDGRRGELWRRLGWTHPPPTADGRLPSPGG